MSRIKAAALLGAAGFLFAVAAPRAAAAKDEACTLLTPAQVGHAFGAPMQPGAYVTPKFKETCAWTASDASKGYVTLNLQDAAGFQSGKQLSNMSTGAAITPLRGMGNDAYYLTVGKNVGLVVRKGKASFRVAVYSDEFSMEKKKSVEKALARQVLIRL